MNPIKKIYCRVFQKAFRIAIPLLPYRKPEILNGLDELPQLFASKKIRSVLLVTDKGIRSRGLTSHLEKLLADNGIQTAVYDGTVANPTTDNVEEARTLYLASHAQAIIGFGGGSSIDAAKAVGARIAYPRKPLSRMEGILKVLRRIPLLVAVPTTAGTGSETTLASVIVDSRTRHKYPINSFPLIPRYAVLDPEVTRTLPPSLTASTGLDALTHAIEAYIGGSTTKETRAAAEVSRCSSQWQRKGVKRIECHAPELSRLRGHGIWGRRCASNARPSAHKAVALPTELQRHEKERRTFVRRS